MPRAASSHQADVAERGGNRGGRVARLPRPPGAPSGEAASSFLGAGLCAGTPAPPAGGCLHCSTTINRSPAQNSIGGAAC